MNKIWTISDKTVATLNCTTVSTIGLCFFTNSPVKNIWNANPNAHIIVKKSPKFIVKSTSKDNIPIPKIAIILLIIPYLSSGLL